MTSAAFRIRRSWSPTSAWTQGSAGPASRLRAAGGSPSGAPRAPVGRWSRRPGASSISPGPCTPSTSASARAAAVVASARKLAILFWYLLAREEDYAHQQPSLTAKKLRRLEITAGAPTLKGTRTGVWANRAALREAERRLAEQAEASYTRMVRDWQAATPAAARPASVTPGAHLKSPRRAKSRGRPRAPDVCASTQVSRLAPSRSLTPTTLLTTRRRRRRRPRLPKNRPN